MAHTIENCLQHRSTPLPLAAIGGDFDLHRRHVIRRKTQIYVQQSRETSQQQARADQKPCKSQVTSETTSRDRAALVAAGRGSSRPPSFQRLRPKFPPATLNAGTMPKSTATTVATRMVRQGIAIQTHRGSGSDIWLWRARYR